MVMHLDTVIVQSCTLGPGKPRDVHGDDDGMNLDINLEDEVLQFVT